MFLLYERRIDDFYNIYNISPDGVYYLVLDMQIYDFKFAIDNKFTVDMQITGTGNLSATLQDAATGTVYERKDGNFTVISTTFTPPQKSNSEKSYRIIYKLIMMGDPFVSAVFTINDFDPSEIFSFGPYCVEIKDAGLCAFYGVYDKNVQNIVIPAYYGIYPVTYIGSEQLYECTSLTSVKFENKTGWKVADSATMSYAKDVTISDDTAQNANLLTNTYCRYNWKRYE